MDAEYLAIESSEKSKGFASFKPALRLLTTVVSANQQGFVTVDAGLKTIYKDGATPFIVSPGFENMKYDWFGDEYGKIMYSENDKPPSIGTVLELVTSHCDPTINLFDKFYVTKSNEAIDEWPIDLRGCSQ
jgi:D-serine deaminase-like pyridoxal phosphate-dependent protein